MNTHELRESDSNQPPTKRRKIQLACTQCRERKVRCDGERPACGTCGRRGKAAACVYGHDELPTLQHVRDVESRLQQLEAQTRRQTSQVGAATVSETTELPPMTSNQLPAFNHIGHGSSSRNVEDNILNRSLARDTQQIAHVDGITELGRTSFKRSSATDMHASLCSSNLGFLRSLDSTWLETFDGKDNGQEIFPVPKPLWKRSESSMMLPRRPLADDLLHAYFTFAHDFLPVAHRPSLEKKYERLWTTDTPSEYYNPHDHIEDGINLAIINVCFALGSLFSELIADEDRESTAEEFYQMSRALTNFDICDYSSLSAVVLQLITGLYLQTTSHTSRCWNIVGMAIRLAQDLGLHKESSGYVCYDVVEMELRRRVWYSCVVMDRLLASIYGRPTTISRASDVQLPSAVDCERTVNRIDGSVTKELMPGAPMFCLSVKLLDIFHEILETVYTGSKHRLNDRCRSRARNEESLRDSLKLNSQLDQFLKSMPERLGSFISTSSTDFDQACDLGLHEQALVTRFLYARIMLLRPLILDWSPHRSSDLEPTLKFDLESNVLRECCSLCLRSSELLVLSVRRDGTLPRRLADWHTVYLTFTAAITFLAVVRFQVLPKTELQRRFQVFERNCIAVLHSTNLQNTLMSQLETSLSFLHDALFSFESFGGAPVDSTSTISSEYHLDQYDTRPVVGPLDNVTQDSALDTGDVWHDEWDTEFGNILGQQFLDPSWLRY